MNIENLGAGGVGGLMTGVLALLGIRETLNNQQKQLDHKVDIDTCEVCQKANHDQFQSIHSKLDILIAKSNK